MSDKAQPYYLFLQRVVQDAVKRLRVSHAHCGKTAHHQRSACPWPVMWDEDVEELTLAIHAAINKNLAESDL